MPPQSRTYTNRDLGRPAPGWDGSVVPTAAEQAQTDELARLSYGRGDDKPRSYTPEPEPELRMKQGPYDEANIGQPSPEYREMRTRRNADRGDFNEVEGAENWVKGQRGAGVQDEDLVNAWTDEGERKAIAQGEDESRVGPVIDRSMRGGLAAASLLPGPAGWAANAGVAGLQAADTYMNPTAGNAALLGLTALPAMGPAIRAAKSASTAAKAAKAARSFEGVSPFAGTAEKAYRMGGSVDESLAGLKTVAEDIPEGFGGHRPFHGAPESNMPAEFYSPGQEAAYNAPRAAAAQTAPSTYWGAMSKGSDDVSMNMAKVHDAKTASRAAVDAEEGATAFNPRREADELDAVTTRADQEWQAANPAMPRPRRQWDSSNQGATEAAPTWPPRARVQLPPGGVKTDAELSRLVRDQEVGRDVKLGSQQAHKDLANLDNQYQHGKGLTSHEDELAGYATADTPPSLRGLKKVDEPQVIDRSIAHDTGVPKKNTGPITLDDLDKFDDSGMSVVDDADDIGAQNNASGGNAISTEAVNRANEMTKAGEEYVIMKHGVERKISLIDGHDYEPQAGEVLGIKQNGKFRPTKHGEAARRFKE